MPVRPGLALVALLALAACGGRRPPDIVVVVVDTLRADRLGCYGSGQGLTPFLDSLAARGHLFRHAYAQSSWTNPSVASLLTSRYQSQHGVVAFGSVLAADELTLPEVLQQAGYATGAFSANGVLAGKLGYQQGFDVYHAHLVHRSDEPSYLWRTDRADVINQEALGWLDATRRAQPGKPIFLYLQYMETHIPYDPPADVLARVRKEKPPPDLRRLNEAAYIGGIWGVAPDVLRDIVDVYDAEVRAIDDGLAALFAQLAARGVLEHAVVVVTADHGEEFEEHGHLGHAKTLYDEVIQVPLLVLLPGQQRPLAIDRVVSLIDVAPTLVALAGAPPPAPFEGASLVPNLRRPGLSRVLEWLLPHRGADGPGVAYSELLGSESSGPRATPHERALVVGADKVILGTGGEQEFYRLDRDPGEHDRDGIPDGERTRLLAQMAEVRARAERRRTPGEIRPLDEETKERLRALGYTQ
jgi:arylsulfatase